MSRVDDDLGFDDTTSLFEEIPEPTDEQQPDYDRGVEVLPEAPSLNGRAQYSNIHGAKAKNIGGRAVNPKLYSQAALFPECTTLRVWKIENGIPSGLGVIDAEATEEDLITNFQAAMPKEGEGKAYFRARPLDINGNELGQEIPIVINEHHAALQKIRKQRRAEIAANQAGGQRGIPDNVLAVLSRTVEMQHQSLKEERARTREILHQMAQERIDLASNAATGIQALSERMMNADAARHSEALEAERRRNEQSNDNMAAFFQSNLEVGRQQQKLQEQNAKVNRDREQTFYQMMLEQERARAERDRQASTQQMEQMRIRMEEQRRADREEWERKESLRRSEAREAEKRREQALRERESDRKRQHEMRLRELDMQAQRDREHQERMMQLQTVQMAQSGGGEGIKDMLKDGFSFLESVGIEPASILQRVISPPESGGGAEVIDAITKMGGEVAGVVKEAVKAKAQVATAKANSQSLSALSFTPSPSAYPSEVPELSMSEENEEAAPEEAKPKRLNVEGMALSTQRNARNAIRNLVNKSRRAKTEEELEEVITVSLTSEPAIYHYANGVSVRRALQEAKADPPLIEKIVSALSQSPLVPEDLNYGE